MPKTQLPPARTPYDRLVDHTYNRRLCVELHVGPLNEHGYRSLGALIVTAEQDPGRPLVIVPMGGKTLAGSSAPRMARTRHPRPVSLEPTYIYRYAPYAERYMTATPSEHASTSALV
jgi:hypothetical protein